MSVAVQSPVMHCPPLGTPIPPLSHAVSVSLPLWRDNEGYEEGEPRVINAMQTGYPRFFVNRTVQKLAGIAEDRFAPQGGEQCWLYPSRTVATACKDFLAARAIPCRIVAMDIPVHSADDLPTVIYAVFVAKEFSHVAKSFWQHAGDGISSRLAAHCLEQLSHSDLCASSSSGAEATPRVYSRNRHYSKSTSPDSSLILSSDKAAEENQDLPQYVEERYGRNLARKLGPVAKVALRRRIAGVLCDAPTSLASPISAGSTTKQSDRGIPSLTEHDVWLYPSGMSAIYHAHQLALRCREDDGAPAGKSICFGFPYTDTLKVLEKWGPGCHHFGNGLEPDIDDIERLLEETIDSREPPVLALFCEFPSNPLLRTPNLRRLRRLADRHGFMVVVDETVGTFHNVEVLPFADLVVSSLTKVFSGDANVMGGSLVINPTLPFAPALQQAAFDLYEDTLYDEDAIFLERNSRNFQDRIARIDASTERLCDQLYRERGHGIIKDVYYPKFVTTGLYRECARVDPDGRFRWGGMCSVTFHDRATARAFYDALPCCKGPSLGTNFTLASPYTLLAHYTELDWAARWGVDSNLIRISVGLEPIEVLLSWFERALSAAKKAAGSS